MLLDPGQGTFTTKKLTGKLALVTGGSRGGCAPAISALLDCSNAVCAAGSRLRPMLHGRVSCGTVKPWQRATLADYTMRADRDPLGAAFNEHVWLSREEASGGTGMGGGGCGCN
jgi:hypothetical protein